MEPDPTIQTVRITKVNDRHYKNVRIDLNLDPLMADIELNGQKVPINVDHHFELVDGKRRLEAMYALGYAYISVKIGNEQIDVREIGNPYNDPDPAGLNDNFDAPEDSKPKNRW